jgi:hypothetical protein
MPFSFLAGQPEIAGKSLDVRVVLASVLYGSQRRLSCDAPYAVLRRAIPPCLPQPEIARNGEKLLVVGS